jgi:hypothetical protein
MPYGVSKEAGGDSHLNDVKMERCIESILAKGKVDKVTAIKICKSQLFGKKS